MGGGGVGGEQLFIVQTLLQVLGQLPLFTPVSHCSPESTTPLPQSGGGVDTLTVHESDWPALVTVTVLVPVVEYEVEKLLPFPDDGEPPGADQE